MFKRILTYIAIILISTITIISIDNHHTKQVKGKETVSAAQLEDENIKLTDEIIKEKIAKFKDQLIQTTNIDGKVQAYKTKEAFINSFNSIASTDAFSQFIDVLYYEQEDGLYLSSLDTPPWFNTNNDYDMIETEKNMFVIKQENTSALNGTYTISFKFFYDDGWKIQNVDYE